MNFFKKIKRHLIVILATGFYSGYAPVASGTFGTLVAVVLYLPLHSSRPLVDGLGLVLATLFSFWIAEQAQKIFQEQDSGKIVIDEVIGFFFTMWALPLPADQAHFWIVIGLAFLIFRVFDILKPFPARLIDVKLHNGVGVVLDDIVAGIYANLVLRLILKFIF